MYFSTSYKMAQADSNNNPPLTPEEVVSGANYYEYGLHTVPCYCDQAKGEDFPCNCEEHAGNPVGISVLSYAGANGAACGMIPIYQAFNTGDVDATIQAIITNVRAAKTWFETPQEWGGYIFDLSVVVAIEEPTEANVRNFATELVNRYRKRE